MDTNKNENKAIIKKSNNQPIRGGEGQSVELRRRGSKNANVRPEQTANRVVVVETKKRNKKPLPVGSIFTIAVMTLLFIFLIMNYAEIDNNNREVASLKDQLTDLQKAADKLEQRLDKKNDLVYFEEYAVENLGMVKSTDLTQINITALPENTGEAFRYDDERTGIGVLLAGFGDVLRDFFD